MRLDDLLRQPEGKTLEFKLAVLSSEPLLRTLVAFANTAGGTILLGVEDRTRRVVGVNDPIALEARLANMISDAIRPRLIPDIEILPWRKTHLVAVRVYPGPARPYYLKAQGPYDGVFLRVGSTNRRADRVMVDDLRRFSQGRTFDEQPMEALNSEAIDFRAASEFFRRVRRLTKRDLGVLGLLVEFQDVLRPTVGGVLLFGKERQRSFPDAYVQAGCFRGIDRTHPAVR